MSWAAYRWSLREPRRSPARGCRPPAPAAAAALLRRSAGCPLWPPLPPWVLTRPPPAAPSPLPAHSKRGHRVITIAPRYDQYWDAWDTSVSLNVQGEEVRFFHRRAGQPAREHPCRPRPRAALRAAALRVSLLGSAVSLFIAAARRLAAACRCAARVVAFGSAVNWTILVAT